MKKYRIRGLPGRTSEQVIAKSGAIKGRSVCCCPAEAAVCGNCRVLASSRRRLKGVGVDGVDVVANGLFKLLRGAMNAAAQLFFSEHRKEAFHLVQPGGPVGVKWTCQRGCRASQRCTAGVLWVA